MVTTYKRQTKVAGVTFEGRQSLLQQIDVWDECRIVKDPMNPFDPNALRVEVVHGEMVWHIGFVPREIAAEIALVLKENVLPCRIERITGGFTTSEGEKAALGMRIAIEIPYTPDAQ